VNAGGTAARLGPLVVALAVALPGGAAAIGQLPERTAPAGDEAPAALAGVGIEEHPGARVPLDVRLTDHTGREVTLGERFGHGRPVILTLGYYGCPMLCSVVLNGLVKGLKGLPYRPGTDFDVVSVSIEPKETVALAAEKRANYVEELGADPARPGWWFHVAAASESRRLADAVGFRYRWDERTGQWAHAAAIYVLTPDGRISRYLYGIDFAPATLKLALVEAGEGKTGNTVDKLLLYCFHYDPAAGSYVFFATNVMKLGGLLTLAGLGGFLLHLWRGNRRRRDEVKEGHALR
jgi:protein SCO1/2